MLAWEKNNSKDKHGAHKYSAEDIGITEQQIADDFKAYRERFSEYM